MARVCSECTNSLAGLGPKATTCGATCRTRRARRKAKEALELGEGGVAAIERQARGDLHAQLPAVTREQLIPVVREAITEDVMRAIKEMVGLTPLAVAALQRDLQSEDDVIRGKATATALKYTVGHPALVTHEDSAAGSQINVTFALPRPDDIQTTDVDAKVIEPDPEPDRTCDLCHETKPAAEMYPGADRCWDCFTKWQQTIRTQYATTSTNDIQV